MARSLGKPRPGEIFTREYWLRHCEEFVVETSSGCDVGYVEEVLLTPTGDATAFVVWVDRDHPHLAVVARCPGDDAAAVDGAGQHEAVVVVGVLADEVDAAGCLRQADTLAPECLQQCGACQGGQGRQAHDAGSDPRSAR